MGTRKFWFVVECINVALFGLTTVLCAVMLEPAFFPALGATMGWAIAMSRGAQP